MHRKVHPLFYCIGKFVLYSKKPSGQDAHELVWMHCVPNSAPQSMQAHWEHVKSRERNCTLCSSHGPSLYRRSVCHSTKDLSMTISQHDKSSYRIFFDKLLIFEVLPKQIYSEPLCSLFCECQKTLFFHRLLGSAAYSLW